MKLLEYVKEDACDSDAATSEHFVYLNEVIELDPHVSLILVVPPREEICTMDERVGGPSVLPTLIPSGALRLLRAHKKSLQVPSPPLPPDADAVALADADAVGRRVRDRQPQHVESKCEREPPIESECVRGQVAPDAGVHLELRAHNDGALRYFINYLYFIIIFI